MASAATVALSAGQELQAGQVRQMVVEQDAVRFFAQRDIEAVLAALGFEQLAIEARGLCEGAAACDAVNDIVFNDQDAHGVHGNSLMVQ
jgi:hypothetical protein